MSVAVSQLAQKIVVEGDTEAKAKLTGMSNAAKETSGGFKSMLGNALSFAGGQAIFNLVGQSVGFLKDQIKDTVEVTIKHNDIMAQTAQVIKSTGDASGVSAKQIEDMATNMSGLTDFSEDTIQSGENLLLTFTNIGSKTFPDATKSMLDLSQAMGQDTKSSALQLGKALNDPEKGITALTRVGVTFTQAQKDQIAAMQDAGNMAGAQSIILQELQREFGGSAEAAGKTFGGSLDILKNKLEDAKVKMGNALIPILQQVTSTISTTVLPAIGKFADFLQTPAFQKFASDTGQKISEAFKTIGDFVKNNIVPAFNDFMNVLKSPQFADFVSKLKDLGSTLLSVVSPAFSNNKPLVEGLFNFIKNTALPALSNLVTALTNTVKWLKDHGSAVSFTASLITALYVPAIIKAGVEAVLAGAKTAAGFIANIIKVGVEGFQAGAKLLTFIINIIKVGVESAIAGTKIAVNFVGGIIKSGVESAIAGIKIAVNFVGSIIKSGVESAIAGTKIAVNFVGSIIKVGVESAIAGVKLAVNFVGSMIATGTQAVLAGAKIVGSFIVSLVSAGIEAITSGAIIMASVVPALIATAGAALATAAPFILIGLVIAAVVIGIILAIQHWSQIVAWFQGIWTVAWNAVSTFFVGIWNNIIAFLQNAWNFIVNAAKAGAALLLAMIIGPIGLLVIFIMQHWDQIRKLTEQLFNAVVNFFSELPGKIMSFLQSLPGKIVGIWNNIIIDATNAGSSIVKGIADGITGAIHFVTDAIGNVTNWISQHLPHSPAKVGPLMHLAEQGANIVDQISIGMLAGLPKLDSAIATIAKPINMSLTSSSIPSGVNLAPIGISNQQPIHIHNYIDGREITDNNIGPRVIKSARTNGPLRGRGQ